MIFKKSLLNTKCVFWFSLQRFPETFLILRWTEQNVIANVHRSSYKVPIIIARYQWNLNFLYRFSKNIQISNFMKICPVWAEMFDVDGRKNGWTDMKLKVAFCNIAHTPKKDVLEIHCMFYSPYTYCFQQFLFQWIFQGWLNYEERNDSGIFNINLQQIFSPQNYIQYIFNYTVTPNRLNKNSH